MPTSPHFLRRPAETPGSCASIFSFAGKTSLSIKSRVVRPNSFCSSLTISGMKISSSPTLDNNQFAPCRFVFAINISFSLIKYVSPSFVRRGLGGGRDFARLKMFQLSTSPWPSPYKGEGKNEFILLTQRLLKFFRQHRNDLEEISDDPIIGFL